MDLLCASFPQHWHRQLKCVQVHSESVSKQRTEERLKLAEHYKIEVADKKHEEALKTCG